MRRINQVSKSQRIRQAFSNLSELRNPMITGRQRINKKYLMQGKKAVKDAIKAGKKTGEPFSKSQLADIAQQRTDIPERAAEKRGGGKKLPPNLGPSDRQVATKKALMKQNSSTEYYRAGLRALFESVLDEAQDPKKLQRLQNKRLKPMTAWDATINILPKAKTRSQKKVDKRAAELRAKKIDYPDPQDP